MPRRGWCRPPSASTARPSRSTSAPGVETTMRELAATIARLHLATTACLRGTRRIPDGQPRRAARRDVAPSGLFGFRARTPVRRGAANAPSTGTAPPRPRMRLADRLRAAGTRADPFLVGGDRARRWLFTVMVALRGDTHGWRFEHEPPRRSRRFRAPSSLVVHGRPPTGTGPGILWPIAARPRSSSVADDDGRRWLAACTCCSTSLVLAPLGSGGGLLGLAGADRRAAVRRPATVAFWVLAPAAAARGRTRSVRPRVVRRPTCCRSSSV